MNFRMRNFVQSVLECLIIDCFYMTSPRSDQRIAILFSIRRGIFNFISKKDCTKRFESRYQLILAQVGQSFFS